MCGGEIPIGIFVMCIPLRKITSRLVNDITQCSHSLSQNKGRLLVRSQDTLLLKWTKNKQSVYDKMPNVNVFPKFCVTFQVSFWSITERRSEK